jgi:alpha-ketoglutarate-dependent taurine dioxygenase
VISNVKDPKTNQPVGALGYGEAEWHTDMSYIAVPPMASVLLSREVRAPSLSPALLYHALWLLCVRWY